MQTHRFVRVETHEIAPGHCAALLLIDAPPVNSLNERSLDELNTVLQHLAQQERIEAVVISGARGAFVAGADVKELLDIGETGDPASARTPVNAAHTAFSLLETLGKPTIAAVNGPALGGGCELSLACAAIVAERRAIFGQPEINLNLLPGYGGTQRLVRRLHQQRGAAGLRDAIRLIASGRSVTADEARAMGLVDRLVSRPEYGAVEAATALLRAHFSGGDALRPMLKRQRRRLDTREAPIAMDKALLAAPDLKRTFAQLRAGGRGACLERILDAIRHGARHGQRAGLRREAALFTEAVCDPRAGRAGIRAFLQRRSRPLPMRHSAVPAHPSAAQRAALEAAGELLPLHAPFFAGVTPLPRLQYGMGVGRRESDGAPAHGDPEVAERLLVLPTPQPGPNEALVYVLASEMNFNDIWAITGIPVSPFDARDADVQVTGSGGVGLIAQLGEALASEGRLSVGQLVTIYSGQSELLSPDQGLDSMAADFRIQGYERNDGAHAQFLVVQGPHSIPSCRGSPSKRRGLTDSPWARSTAPCSPPWTSNREPVCSWRAPLRAPASTPCAPRRPAAWRCWAWCRRRRGARACASSAACR